MIETSEIKLTPKKMFSFLFLLNGKIWILIALSGVVIFTVLGIAIDPRFFVLALIWVFLVIPMLTAFLYFFYGMKPLTAFNLIEHNVLFTDKEIQLNFPRKENEENRTSDLKEYKIPNSDFESIKTGPDYIIVNFRNQGWMWLPLEAFTSIDELNKVVGIITSKN